MPARRMIDFLALKPSLVVLLVMVVLVGLGSRMAERFLPIYLIALGAGPMAIGLLNGLTNLLSALYAFAGGTVSDRVGSKRALMIFNLMAVLGFSIVIAIPSWPAVIVGALFFHSWSAISLPAAVGLIYQVLPAGKRTMGISMHSMVQRIPMALGPVIGGLMIDRWGEVPGTRIAFAVAALLAAVSALIQQRWLPEASATAQGSSGPLSLKAVCRLDFPPAWKNLLVADILVRFCEQIPYAFVVVWCMKRIASPVTAAQFGVLTAIEMATAMLIYVPVAVYADRGPKKPFVTATFLFFSLFPVALYFCESFAWLAAAFVLRGLKEFGEPSRKALILELSPDHARASAFGLYYLIRDGIVALAVLGGAVLWQVDPRANLLAAAAFGLLGTAWFARKG